MPNSNTCRVVVGSQIGKTILAAGAAVEGGMSIGVVVMSLLAASKYSRKSEGEELEQQQLTGEMCSLVLVRPDIEVDTVWAEYTASAKESWAMMNGDSLKSSWGSGFGSLFSSSDLNEQATEIRYHRDVDIIAADGSELAIGEKVFLLVNRILNDKMSLPGYVYRYLIRKCIVRGSACNNEANVPVSSPNYSCGTMKLLVVLRAVKSSLRILDKDDLVLFAANLLYKRCIDRLIRFHNAVCISC